MVMGCWPRRGPAVLAALVAGSAAVSAVVISTPPSAAGTQPYAFCPAAKHILGRSTHWHHHRLAPGISLAETTAGAGRARLRVNVVKVVLGRHDHGRRRASVAPVHHTLTTHRRLTRLADRPHLVAATNGGYFDAAVGAPREALIEGGAPLVLSRHHSRVAGIGVDDRARDGRAWLVGHVQTGHGRHRLGALNENLPATGLSVYTPVWGSRPVVLPARARSRVVHRGRVAGPVTHRRHVPRHGALLVATTRTAVHWLHSLRRSGRVSVDLRARTDAPHRFREAYLVGTQVVASAHHVKTGLYCRRGEVYAARTDIAWRDNGRTLLLATVVSPRGSDNYGVDENQMSQVMVRLGASRSYALDGGGSTDMVARLPGRHGMSIRTRRHHETERPIPVGIGVYSMHVHHVKARKPARRGHKHHRRHPHPAPSSPLGGLLGLL
jgi:hypothetical protein